MYGSYGSYSSMCSVQMSAPLDISPSYSKQQDASCAFPSWPRRTSLSESDCEQRATSFLSDEDLFPAAAAAEAAVFEDDAQSVSSAGSNISTPASGSPQIVTEAQLLEMERERQAYQREVTRFLLSEKERRRQAAGKRQRRSSSHSKKSPKPKHNLAPIAEAGGE
ncbi:uncharacterized protein E0L32_012292 [Thyridium curvatum]|uniref:Uncharacterized protein n=1 Tax=Thyridium curvatum TaxID=1093900 RepID=A0A507BK29_9PEZI|nr:uncharacterized protein E0L32_012292 [Thyridium curvatum]TPX17058.1 hypothetical protein E0L32_012292 [Thyridium curvatum]